MYVMFVLHSKRAFSNVLKGKTYKIFRSFRSRICNLSSTRMMPSTYSLCNLQNFAYPWRDISVYSLLNYLGASILHSSMTFDVNNFVSTTVPIVAENFARNA